MPQPTSNTSPERRRLSAAALLFPLAIAGLAIWLLVSRTTKFEAWDNDTYFFIGVPLMFAMCAAAGYLNPNVRWSAGFATVSLQLVALIAKNGLNLLTVVAGGGSFLLIALALTAGGWMGSALRR